MPQLSSLEETRVAAAPSPKMNREALSFRCIVLVNVEELIINMFLNPEDSINPLAILNA